MMMQKGFSRQREWIIALVVELMAVLLSALPASAQELIWEQTTNGPYGGNMGALLATPEGVLFLGTWVRERPTGSGDGMVFISEDGGKTWINRATIGAGIYSLAVLGTTIFAGAWEGVYRSEDNGNSWINVGLSFPDGSIHSLAIIGKTIFAGHSYRGVYRSDDMGKTWLQTRLTDLNVSSLAVMDKTLFAANEFPGARVGVYRSEDNGDTWVKAGLENTNVNSLAVMDKTLFAGTRGGVYRSEDNGDTWVKAGLENTNVDLLAVMDKTLFAGAGGVFRSEDKGRTWIETKLPASPVHAEDKGIAWIETKLPDFPVHALAVMKTTIFAGIYGSGIFRSDDKGDTWISAGGIKTDVTSLAVMGKTTFAVTKDRDLYRSEDNGNSWIRTRLSKQRFQLGIVDIDIRSLAVIGTTIFAHVHVDLNPFIGSKGIFAAIYRSDDEGKTWTHLARSSEEDVSTWKPLYSNFPLFKSMLVSGKTLLAGVNYRGIYRSEDNGSTWRVTLPLGTTGPRSLVASGTTLFAGTNRGVFRSEDDGNTWVWVKAGLDENIKALEVIGTTLFAVAGREVDARSINSDLTGEIIYRSEDMGETWLQLGLTNLDIRSLAVMGTTLFVGTDKGVFRSEDMGKTWLQSGLIDLDIRSLAVMGTTLFAAANRGVFRASVSVTSPPWDVNADGEVNIFDLVIIAKNLSQEVKEGDVNKDGKVDIFDLVTVANHFGESSTGASPSLGTTQMDYSQYLPVLERAYQLLQSSSDSSPEFEMARKLLEHLISLADLADLSVKETKLHPNYPNPFNPETWIPYQLAESADVTVEIYDVTGRLVRTLRIGHQVPGLYISKDKAAYLDGRNDVGESVASGVYYYKMQAGRFVAIRKMIIAK